MYKLIFTVFFIISSLFVSGQCLNDTLTIGHDTTLCTGQSIVLKADQAYISYLWNNNNTTSSITVNSPGTYICTAKIVDSTSLVFNGDFTYGNVFINSDYIYGTGGSYGLLSSEGQYAISTNASLTHTNFASCTDHTTGTGNFMIVNGSSTANLSVWCQTVGVAPNTDYIFSAWFTSVHPSNPAILNFSIDGVAIGPNVNVSSTTCNWQNFFQTWTSNSTQTTATICIKNQNINPSGNDFAIDDIYFAQVCKFSDTVVVGVNPYPTPNLGNDTIFCQGDSLILRATSDSISTYLWSDNSTDSLLTVYNSGIYSVNVANGYCEGNDTINVTVAAYPQINLGNDTLICTGTNIVLDAGQNPGNILWNDNSTNQTLNVSSSGVYWVKIDNQGCENTDTISIIISQGPNPILLPKYAFCEGDSVILDPGVFATYLWNTGSNSSNIYVKDSGINTYQVQVWDGDGCTDSVSTEVTMIEMPVPIIFSNHDSICFGTTLNLEVSGGDNYLWNNGSNSNLYVVKPIKPMLYSVTATNSFNGTDCSADTSIFVYAKNCNTLFVPKAFTPDGDGLNDEFGPVGEFNLEYYEMYIYDRWGKLVFSTTNPNENWNGKDANGNEFPTGVFTYIIKAKAPESEPYELAGTVHLIK